MTLGLGTRAANRDLCAFTHADKSDVQLIDYGDGLRFVSFGIVPEQRMLVESLYVLLILKNGVPVGYTQAHTLFRSAEVNFNIFDSFRGMEVSYILSSTLAMIRHLFDCDTFRRAPRDGVHHTVRSASGAAKGADKAGSIGEGGGNGAAQDTAFMMIKPL